MPVVVGPTSRPRRTLSRGTPSRPQPAPTRCMMGPMSTTGVVIGAGDRGYDAYATLLLEEPDLGRIVGVADPDERRRTRFSTRYSLGPDECFAGWEELFARPRMADYAIVATGDAHHVEPTLAALDAGYHVLLEKPMALDETDAVRIVDAAASADRVVAVCHVYRYSHLFSALPPDHRVGRSRRRGLDPVGRERGLLALRPLLRARAHPAQHRAMAPAEVLPRPGPPGVAGRFPGPDGLVTPSPHRAEGAKRARRCPSPLHRRLPPCRHLPLRRGGYLPGT